MTGPIDMSRILLPHQRTRRSAVGNAIVAQHLEMLRCGHCTVTGCLIACIRDLAHANGCLRPWPPSEVSVVKGKCGIFFEISVGKWNYEPKRGVDLIAVINECMEFVHDHTGVVAMAFAGFTIELSKKNVCAMTLSGEIVDVPDGQRDGDLARVALENASACTCTSLLNGHSLECPLQSKGNS